MSLLLAKRYAQCLFDAAPEKKLSIIHKDLNKLLDVIHQSSEFNKFLNNPAISKANRDKILNKIFIGKCDGLTLRFLLFLSLKDRLFTLKDICSVFEEIYLEKEEILNVTVICSCPLNNHQMSGITQHLKLRFRKEINASYEVDPGLIAGLKVKVKDKIYDSSVSHQLVSFKDQLINA